MRMKTISLGLLSAVTLVLASGCDKGNPQPAQTAAKPQQTEAVAQVHWLGMDRVAAETNAARFITIWREPETRKLVNQTLTKIANWISQVNARPEGGSPLHPSKADEQSALVRPLLDDLVQAESYLKVQQGSSTKPSDLLLAIRLNPKRVGLWESNIASVLERTTGTRPTTAAGSYGWQAEIRSRTRTIKAPPSASRFLSLWRSGDWTMLSFCCESKRALEPVPVPGSDSTYWLKADFDPIRVSQALALDWKFPPDTPRVSVNAVGDGDNVITRGELKFAQPFTLGLEPWNVPTNLIHGNLITLTAARDVAPWLGKLAIFSNCAPADWPNQIYLWALNGSPTETFFALSLANARDVLNELSGPITNWANPKILPKNGGISLDPTKGVLSWTNLPQAMPFLKAVSGGSPQFLFGGFGPELRGAGMPSELREHILADTNLVYFSWEDAGKMILHWRYLDDVYRLAFDNLGPRLSGTASMNWLATNLTNLSHTVTEVHLEQPNSLSFIRKSRVGLNSLELEALANWLEMPQFPRGLGHLMDTNPGTSFASIIEQRKMRARQRENSSPPSTRRP